MISWIIEVFISIKRYFQPTAEPMVNPLAFQACYLCVMNFEIALNYERIVSFEEIFRILEAGKIYAGFIFFLQRMKFHEKF